MNETDPIERKFKCKDNFAAAQEIRIYSCPVMDFLCKHRSHLMEFSFCVAFFGTTCTFFCASHLI